MHAHELQKLLSQHSLFADSDDDALAAIILRGHLVTAQEGDVLLHQGDKGDILYIILSGMARISMVASNGHEIVLDYAEAGHVIGEIAFLDGGERSASVDALSDMTMLTLSRDAFAEILGSYPDLAMQLMKALARRLRQTNEIVEADRAFRSGPRLARYLLRLMLSGSEGDGRLKLKLSQSELGNFVGLSREQINRQLSAWSEHDVISIDSGNIHIKDQEMLMEIAEAIP
ncbi:Crp/Fnr family transcriptional regulator [Alterisphingorhabdus coralli]|uniref:Crp/Fnr family transcriptional regulator n=1 Tax=Alterisphingorhabdus coralli TaxID=3071408 RepID=A0AA97I010_9SPHN|nr:Crp/Fnr family transcriptional regulator [Parasphingorhabdus sp. SCSIO 66989]WOE73953.1 Crp/Fnr family transcriptional regulator [Parasphingorhabdus sp. SCSIO 66989]